MKSLIEVTVWFRQVLNGEIEKELDLLKIEAETPQEAVNKANAKFTSLQQIPFQFLVNGKVLKPTN